MIDMEEETEALLPDAESVEMDDSSIDLEEEEEDDAESSDGETVREGTSTSSVPVILPHTRYAGACNVETVKDVNFLGRQNEFVASGSDDGNFFIWRKDTGELVNILEGDDDVVNVIEENPRFQCCAVSGIDHTVKIFSPSKLPSKFSRISEEEAILDTNSKQSRLIEIQRERFLQLVAQYRLGVGSDDDDEGEGEGEDEGHRGPQCVHQ